MAALLEIKNLSIAFRQEKGLSQAVSGASFLVQPGEIVSLVGESGSGKSITALSVLGLLSRQGKVTGGEILFEGKDILKLKNRSMRSIRGGKIAMIFQDPMTSLDPTMKIGKQIAEAVRLHKAVSRAAAKHRAVELLDMVGIEEPEKRYHQYPHEFSGGQRQRVVIAIALAADPQILIADEPGASSKSAKRTRCFTIPAIPTPGACWPPCPPWPRTAKPSTPFPARRPP